jgi:4-hydroxybenzoate polyprenyltransferase
MFLFSFISKYFGWRNWAVFYYNSFIENIFVALLLLFNHNDFSNTGLMNFFFFLGFSLFATSFGYLLNDLADKDLDKEHDKPNTFQNDSKGKAIFILLVFFVFCIGFGFKFFENGYFLFVWLCWLFLTVSYSLPPLRFKERGTLGLALVVLAQRGLPAILMLLVFGGGYSPEWILLFLYMLVRGFTSDMTHQLNDWELDMTTNTKTAVVYWGKEKALVYFKWNLLVEKILLSSILFWLALSNQQTGIKNLLFFLPLTIFILVYFLYIYELSRNSRTENSTIPAHQKNSNQILHYVFPNLFLSFYFAVIITFNNVWYALIIIYLVINYKLYQPDVWKNSFVGISVKAVQNKQKKK